MIIKLYLAGIHLEDIPHLTDHGDRVIIRYGSTFCQRCDFMLTGSQNHFIFYQYLILIQCLDGGNQRFIRTNCSINKEIVFFC
jgi:hypothetical protein